MSSIFDGMAAIFVETLGEDDLLPYSHAGTTTELRGIFANPHAQTPGSDEGAPLAGSMPSLSTAAADLPAGAGEGDTVVVRGITWRVLGPPQPDGRGMTVLLLEKVA